MCVDVVSIVAVPAGAIVDVSSASTCPIALRHSGISDARIVEPDGTNTDVTFDVSNRFADSTRVEVVTNVAALNEVNIDISPDSACSSSIQTIVDTVTSVVESTGVSNMISFDASSQSACVVNEPASGLSGDDPYDNHCRSVIINESAVVNVYERCEVGSDLSSDTTLQYPLKSTGKS